MVVSTNGTVEYMNPALSRSIGYPASGQVSAKLEDVYGSAFADERLAYLKDAHREGRTVTVVGMLRGVLMRSVYRPLPDDGSGVGRVLSVCRPATVSAAEDGVIRAKGDDSGRLGTLTSREMDILKLIGQGLSTAEIAKKLHRSVKTVEWHRVSLGNKLGVTNRVELARIAIAAGIVTVGMSDVNALRRNARPDKAPTFTLRA